MSKAAGQDMVEALQLARRQLVTLGGEVVEHEGKIISDLIQAAILAVIDAALAKALGESPLPADGRSAA